MATLIRQAFEAMEALPSSTALRESITVYPILLTAHLLGMCLFLGLVVMMDLRLAGLGFRSSSFSGLQKRLFPLQMLGLAVTSATGLLLFYSQPMRYYGRPFFWLKITTMACAGVNAVVFHRTTYRSVDGWDDSAALPFNARIAAFLSLALWSSVVVFGRLTAYDWWTFTP
jgi:hypothetical protein